jgi:hypothetical protein
MRITRRSTLVGVLTGIFGASRAMGAKVRAIVEDGFADLDLPLAEAPKKIASGHRLLAQGIHEGVPVGFAIELHSDWVEKPLEDGSATFYWGRVTLNSIGAASDNFVAMLSKLYGSASKDSPMLQAISAQAVGLGDDPRKFLATPVRMKLFFHAESESRYAKVFLNVDIAGRVVQIHEKDPEYRENVLRALCEQA